MRRLIQVIILAFVLLTNSCKIGHEETFTFTDLKNLDNIDKIEVSYDNYPNSQEIKTFQDPEQVTQIVNMFKKYSNNWRRYIPVPPPAPLVIIFFEEEDVQTVVGIGTRINGSERIYYLARMLEIGRPLEREEFEELITILDVDEDFARD